MDIAFCLGGAFVVFLMVGGFSNWKNVFTTSKPAPPAPPQHTEEPSTAEEQAFWDQFKGTKYEKLNH